MTTTDYPSPKLSGVVRDTVPFRLGIAIMKARKDGTISVSSIDGIKKPIEAMCLALRRWNKRYCKGKYRVYVRKGVIYLVRRET